ncbi:helix-turn-helix transcriptional regulator [Alkalicoccobacillus plakortidis]|uniref:Helix-turn-helix transcriptional regulator n=1 Tax=Alkalicoccobacillus plakortidis TaxID=444060 RepID=A0ABT0XPE6_9BACI|nr:helix-turn-helix transcriptional regulator [Alkalicoccobacillus plakortidis]MCM2677736.1 helix-turn-helix transcriptional regulator [Alkalicoccobacillus plakortidis]
MNTKLLEQKRNEKKLTQAQVAKIIGIDRSYYTKIELGLVPSVKVAKKLAQLFNLEWTIFFENDCAKSAQ